ncbi:hypothetical protein D3C71_2058370 [compost metagenome]
MGRTAKANGQIGFGRIVAMATLGNGASNAEIALPVGHLAELHMNALGRHEGGIDIPARAGARMARDMDARERKAL